MTSRKLTTLVVTTLLVLTAVVGTAPLSVAAAGNTAGNVPVTGAVESAGNEPVDGFVHAATEGWEHYEDLPLGASGNFELAAQQGETYDLGYYQYERDENGDVTFAQDSVPDVYSLGSVDVDGETDLGTTTLPEANLLTVSVVDQEGNPVYGADVTVSHRSDDGSDTASWRMDTNSDGELVNYDNEKAGIEVAGNVELTVDPPEAVVGSKGVFEYADGVYTKDITVTEDRHVEFEVEATTIDENSGSVGGSSGGGGGGSAGQDTPAKVTITDGVAHVSFEPEERGELIRAPLGDGVDAGDATVDRVAVTPVFGYGFELSVADNASTPADSQALGGHTPVEFFDIDTDGVKDGEIESATIKFTVDDGTISGDAAAADVVLYRYHDGEWQALDTEHKRGTTYLATSPGFSTFAIGLSDDGGEDVSSTQSDPANQSTSVSQADSSTTSTTSTNTANPDSQSSTTQTESPGFGVLTVLFALAGFALIARRR